ncbi:hypothetical protein [Nocardia sp. NRRL S-836]|uniref:hypothetical protein n=1 Tax=Nocardia sp. NRRL S-836 TaxID=1519492 RepID=UPI0006ADDEB0|nr:hypothetical protein [Nocardia sp. NRRL S-836]KOV84769.1 hypothetical protein ADL03_16015 [Nocardia sp. NRRL S-836]
MADRPLNTAELSILKELSAYGAVQSPTAYDAVPLLIERDLITHWCDETGTGSLTDAGYAAIGLLFDDAGVELTGAGILGRPRVHLFHSGWQASQAAERQEMCDGDVFYVPADQIIGLVITGSRARSLTFPAVNLPTMSTLDLFNERGMTYAGTLRRIMSPEHAELAMFADNLAARWLNTPPALAWAYHDEYYCPRCIRIVAGMLLHTGDPRENADAAWYYTCALRQVLPEEAESDEILDFPAPVRDPRSLYWQRGGAHQAHTYRCVSCLNTLPLHDSDAPEEGTGPR